MTAAEPRFEIERIIEFSPVIVWDALVDPVLVDGWWATAGIDPRVGGRFDLGLPYGTRAETAGGQHGTITQLRERELLSIETGGIETGGRGAVSFRLDEVAGGFRGTSTRVRLTVLLGAGPDAGIAGLVRARAEWETRMDRLNDLLRGHPMDRGDGPDSYPILR